MRSTIVAILFLAASAAASAPAGASGGYFTWKCSFPELAPMTLVYDYDKDAGIIIGNIGTSPAEVKIGKDAITFLEVLGSGAVQTLTLQVGVTVPALYSRHTLIDGKFNPSQVEGTCEKQ